MSEIVSVFKDTAQLNLPFHDQTAGFSVGQIASNVFDEPDKLANFAAAVSTGEVGELQDVLESLFAVNRLRKALLVLKELINARLQSKLSWDVDSKIAKRQREYHLMERLKGVKMELGMELDGKIKRAATLKMPTSPGTISNGYPDHYGPKDVRDRILKFLAFGKLRGTVEGRVTCLVGPPGVGRTSALKRVGTENPPVSIDEVDKIGWIHNSNPASALLEMLDPEQNNSFLDRYMDAPVGLSLLDRMEVLKVSGYVSKEKAMITDKYLGPRAKEASGLKGVDVVLEPPAIDIYRKAALKLVQELGEETFPEPALVSTLAADTKTVES
ncbi:hypothetical protein BD779DRAFT_1476637 [Infundibulicybe gibba]|nr:hypothetical protein BD779DRAFT_1476637 [Infundibulicybe gibba]